MVWWYGRGRKSQRSWPSWAQVLLCALFLLASVLRSLSRPPSLSLSLSFSFSFSFSFTFFSSFSSSSSSSSCCFFFFLFFLFLLLFLFVFFFFLFLFFLFFLFFFLAFLWKRSFYLCPPDFQKHWLAKSFRCPYASPTKQTQKNE